MKNKQILTIIIVLVAAFGIIAIIASTSHSGTKSSSETETYSDSEETTESTTQTTTETTTQPVPVEAGFENLEPMENEYGEAILVEVHGYSIKQGKVVGSYYSDGDELEFYKGWCFRDGILEGIRYIKSDTDYETSGVYTYNLYDNSNLHLLGVDESNADFIIVERIELSDKATLFKCRECGDEIWYVSANALDWSTLRTEKFNEDDYSDSITIDFLK